MTDDPILSVEGVAKKCCPQPWLSLRYGIQDIMGELLPRRTPAALRRGEFWAVEDVSFELRRGEALAVLGRNGAGKSTLLKMLSGLLKPDRGEIRLRGRVEALIELGTGFNPLLTGRENIEVGAAQHGLSRRRTQRLIEEVLDFSELEAAIDAPFQSYSSGMKARLAYAFAAKLGPDIFLIDEALAVGDHAFQRKCISHMRSYLETGGALLLVSHNVYQIQAVCQRGILLDHGRLVFSGTAVDAIGRQLEQSAALPVRRERPSRTSGPIVIEDLHVESGSGEGIGTGGALRLTLRYHASEAIEGAWGFSIWTADEIVCATGAAEISGRILGPGPGELTCMLPHLPLLPGRYVVRGAIVRPVTRDHLALFGWDGRGTPFEVKASPDAITNAHVHLGQLVKIDVDWQ